MLQESSDIIEKGSGQSILPAEKKTWCVPVCPNDCGKIKILKRKFSKMGNNQICNKDSQIRVKHRILKTLPCKLKSAFSRNKQLKHQRRGGRGDNFSALVKILFTLFL